MVGPNRAGYVVDSPAAQRSTTRVSDIHRVQCGDALSSGQITLIAEVFMNILPEVTQSFRLAQTEATVFPESCPACKSPRIINHSGVNIIEYLRSATYACGAHYTHKPQIQNHTEKWWGTCPTASVFTK